MKDKKEKLRTLLAIATGFAGLGLLFVAMVYREIPTAVYTMVGLFVVLLGALAWMNQQALREAAKTRSVRYGANAALTVGLVLAILVVLNFLNYNHFYRKDLTKDQVHSLSEQTIKVLKDLKSEVKLTAFVKVQARDQLKALVDNYAYLAGSKLKAEYVDPDRDPTRAKALGIKKYGTVILEAGKKENRIEEATEEKLTNGIIKLFQGEAVTACFLTGHGEKSADATGPEGYSQIKKDLASQSYESKNLNLLEEGKIPAECSILLVLGPTKAFFEKEITVLREWLDNGGRALFALDPNLRGGSDVHPEVTKLLADWSVEVKHNLILDPTSRLLGVNASVPLVAIYSKEHAVTRDFQEAALFPLASGIELKSEVPASLKTWWLAKSTPKAFAKSDFKEIATGQVRLDTNKDLAGPHVVMVALEGTRVPAKPEGEKAGEKKEASKGARLIVLGTSQVATNAYARHGANMDLFLNAVSWLASDENLISIRPKEESSKPVVLSQTEGRYIQLFTMILIPGGVLLSGLGVWLRRRKL